MASLDRLPLRPLPAGSPRRAWLRDERLERDRLSIERRVSDLEEVIDAANQDAPVTLLGISQGAAVSLAYAARHPSRVSRIILCGGYARGALRRDRPDLEAYRAIADLAQLWGRDNPAFRQVFTSRFIPDGSDEQLRWFNELCRRPPPQIPR